MKCIFRVMEIIYIIGGTAMENLILPIKSADFSSFIETSKIFEKTTELMKGYLSNWYADNKIDFLECMGAELSVVLKEYSFCNHSVHFVKNFNFDIPHQDYIYCIIDINDKEGYCCTGYKAVFDCDLNAEDDMLC